MNAAADLLKEVQAKGITIEVEGMDLYASGPIDDAIITRLRDHKAELLAILATHPLADLPDPSTATEPFNQEAMDAIKRGQVVPVWSDLLGEWLYWVRDEVKRKALQAQGCTAPIYTLGELAVVANMPPEDIKKLHGIKKAFGGVIQS